MRIDDTPPPAATTDSNDSDTDSKKSDDQKDDASLFSRVLAKTKDGRQEESAAKGMLGGRKEETPSFAALQVPAEFSAALKPEAVAGKHTVEIPVQLQQLVHEISVVASKQQVHIEMNSSVLKGLQVQIEKQNGAVSIQFLTTSPTITTLLSNNLSLLSKGLEDRGVSVSDIRIDSPDRSGSSSFGGGQQAGSRFGGGGQGRKR
jgi:flagellar hook-length control protein FliK